MSGTDTNMELGAFKTLRRAVQVNASFPSQRELGSVEQTLRDNLRLARVFTDIEVESTDNPDGLVIAMCKFPHDLSEADVARTMQAMWEEQVRYPFWAAYSLIVEPEIVELEGATRNSADGSYATVHLVALRDQFPAQRGPSDAE